MSNKNVAVVQEAYAAFGRGDLPGLLSLLSDDVSWLVAPGVSPVDLPMAGQRHGRAAVAEFFQLLLQSVRFTRFEPRDFIAEGDRVVVVGLSAYDIVPTGAKIETEWVMIFTVRDGRIAAFKEFTNTAALVAAFASAVQAS